MSNLYLVKDFNIFEKVIYCDFFLYYNLNLIMVILIFGV